MIEIFWDIETTGLNPFAENFRIRQLTALMFNKRGQLIRTVAGEQVLNLIFRPYTCIDLVLENRRNPELNTLKDYRVIGHKIMEFDILCCSSVYGFDITSIAPDKFFDTLIAQHLIDENNPKSLEALGQRYGADTKKIAIKSDEWAGASLSTLEKRAYNDCLITKEIYPHILREIQKQDLMPLLIETQKLALILLQPTKNGIPVSDISRTKSSVDSKIAEVEGELREIFGRDVNLNSPQQLSSILYGELGIPVERETDSGKASTDKRAIQSLRATYSSVDGMKRLCDLILDYRKLSKIRSSFIIPLESQHITRNLRIHSKYNVTGTVTGRLSSEDPNIQNFPRDSVVRGSKVSVRSLVTPDNPKYSLAEVDYSQLEMRLMAWQANVTSMLEAFKRGWDVHTLTLAKFNNLNYEDTVALVKSDQDWKNRRVTVKPVNFSMIYLGSAETIRESCWDMEVYLPLKEVQNMMNSWFAAYPEFTPYWIHLLDTVRRDGFLRLPSGRTRRIKSEDVRYSLTDGKISYATHAARQAVNFPTQGLAMDILRRALINLSDLINIRRTNDNPMQLLATVHDSIMLQYNRKQLTEEEVHDILYHACVTQVNIDLEKMYGYTGIPLEVDIHVGHTKWGQY